MPRVTPSSQVGQKLPSRYEAPAGWVWKWLWVRMMNTTIRIRFVIATNLKLAIRVAWPSRPSSDMATATTAMPMIRAPVPVLVPNPR